MDRGDHQAAWAISDCVLAARNPAERDDPRLPYHERWVWDGRPVSGQHALVRCYHGLGDTLQFARFLPLLRRQVASLTLEAQPELLSVLAGLPGPDRLLSFDPARPAPPAACDVEIMELSHLLRATPDAAPPPYLSVAPVASQPGAIGLCWKSGGWDPDRAIPPRLLAALPALPWVSLHPEAPPQSLGAINPQGCPPRIADTAALVAGLDLVITVDTMVAHLSGALGRPTWLLLKHDADWRWRRHGRRSAWYPSMLLYRQPRPRDWGAVIAEITRDLERSPWPPATAVG